MEEGIIDYTWALGNGVSTGDSSLPFLSIYITLFFTLLQTAQQEANYFITGRQQGFHEPGQVQNR